MSGFYDLESRRSKEFAHYNPSKGTFRRLQSRDRIQVDRENNAGLSSDKDTKSDERVELYNESAVDVEFPDTPKINNAKSLTLNTSPSPTVVTPPAVKTDATPRESGQFLSASVSLDSSSSSNQVTRDKRSHKKSKSLDIKTKSESTEKRHSGLFGLLSKTWRKRDNGEDGKDENKKKKKKKTSESSGHYSDSSNSSSSDGRERKHRHKKTNKNISQEMFEIQLPSSNSKSSLADDVNNQTVTSLSDSFDTAVVGETVDTMKNGGITRPRLDQEMNVDVSVTRKPNGFLLDSCHDVAELDDGRKARGDDVMELGVDQTINGHFGDVAGFNTGLKTKENGVEYDVIDDGQKINEMFDDGIEFDAGHVDYDSHSSDSDDSDIVVEVGKHDIERGKMDIDHSKMDIEHNKIDIEHSKMDIEHSKMDIEHNKMDIEHNKMDIDENMNVQAGISPNIYTEVGISPHTEVGISSHTEVGISPHTEVGISPHTEVGISPHTEVGISPHTEVGISPHTEVGISPNISTEKVVISRHTEVGIPPHTEKVDISSHFEISSRTENVGISPHTENVGITPHIDTEKVSISPLTDKVGIAPHMDTEKPEVTQPRVHRRESTSSSSSFSSGSSCPEEELRPDQCHTLKSECPVASSPSHNDPSQQSVTYFGPVVLGPKSSKGGEYVDIIIPPNRYPELSVPAGYLEHDRIDVSTAGMFETNWSSGRSDVTEPEPPSSTHQTCVGRDQSPDVPIEQLVPQALITECRDVQGAGQQRASVKSEDAYTTDNTLQLSLDRKTIDVQRVNDTDTRQDSVPEKSWCDIPELTTCVEIITEETIFPVDCHKYESARTGSDEVDSSPNTLEIECGKITLDAKTPWETTSPSDGTSADLPNPNIYIRSDGKRVEYLDPKTFLNRSNGSGKKSKEFFHAVKVSTLSTEYKVTETRRYEVIESSYRVTFVTEPEPEAESIDIIKIPNLTVHEHNITCQHPVSDEVLTSQQLKHEVEKNVPDTVESQQEQVLQYTVQLVPIQHVHYEQVQAVPTETEPQKESHHIEKFVPVKQVQQKEDLQHTVQPVPGNEDHYEELLQQTQFVPTKQEYIDKTQQESEQLVSKLKEHQDETQQQIPQLVPTIEEHQEDAHQTEQQVPTKMEHQRQEIKETTIQSVTVQPDQTCVVVECSSPVSSPKLLFKQIQALDLPESSVDKKSQQEKSKRKLSSSSSSSSDDEHDSRHKKIHELPQSKVDIKTNHGENGTRVSRSSSSSSDAGDDARFKELPELPAPKIEFTKEDKKTKDRLSRSSSSSGESEHESFHKKADELPDELPDELSDELPEAKNVIDEVIEKKVGKISRSSSSSSDADLDADIDADLDADQDVRHHEVHRLDVDVSSEHENTEANLSRSSSSSSESGHHTGHYVINEIQENEIGKMSSSSSSSGDADHDADNNGNYPEVPQLTVDLSTEHEKTKLSRNSSSSSDTDHLSSLKETPVLLEVRLDTLGDHDKHKARVSRSSSSSSDSCKHDSHHQDPEVPVEIVEYANTIGHLDNKLNHKDITSPKASENKQPYPNTSAEREEKYVFVERDAITVGKTNLEKPTEQSIYIDTHASLTCPVIGNVASEVKTLPEDVYTNETDGVYVNIASITPLKEIEEQCEYDTPRLEPTRVNNETDTQHDDWSEETINAVCGVQVKLDGTSHSDKLANHVGNKHKPDMNLYENVSFQKCEPEFKKKSSKKRHSSSSSSCSSSSDDETKTKSTKDVIRPKEALYDNKPEDIALKPKLAVLAEQKVPQKNEIISTTEIPLVNKDIQIQLQNVHEIPSKTLQINTAKEPEGPTLAGIDDGKVEIRISGKKEDGVDIKAQSSPESPPEQSASKRKSKLFSWPFKKKKKQIEPKQDEKAAIVKVETSSVKVEIPAVKVNTQSVKVDKPSLKVDTPSVNADKPTVKIDTPSLKVDTPSVNVDKPSVKIDTPSLKVDTPSLKVDTPSVNVDKPSVTAGTPSLKVDTPYVNVEKPSIKVDTPSLKVDTPSLKVDTPSLKVDTPSVNVDKPSVKIETPSLKVDTPSLKVDTPSANVDKPSVVKVDTPSLKVDTPSLKVDTPSVNVDKPSVTVGTPSLKVDTPYVNVEKPSIKVDTPSLKVDTPSLKVDTPSVNVDKPFVKIDTSSLKVDTPSLNVDTPSVNFNKPSVKVDTPTMKVDTPSLNIDTPSVNFNKPSVKVDIKQDKSTKRTERPPPRTSTPVGKSEAEGHKTVAKSVSSSSTDSSSNTETGPYQTGASEKKDLTLGSLKRDSIKSSSSSSSGKSTPQAVKEESFNFDVKIQQEESLSDLWDKLCPDLNDKSENDTTLTNVSAISSASSKDRKSSKSSSSSSQSESKDKTKKKSSKKSNNEPAAVKGDKHHVVLPDAKHDLKPDKKKKGINFKFWNREDTKNSKPVNGELSIDVPVKTLTVEPSADVPNKQKTDISIKPKEMEMTPGDMNAVIVAASVPSDWSLNLETKPRGMDGSDNISTSSSSDDDVKKTLETIKLKDIDMNVSKSSSSSGRSTPLEIQEESLIGPDNSVPEESLSEMWNRLCPDPREKSDSGFYFQTDTSLTFDSDISSHPLKKKSWSHSSSSSSKSDGEKETPSVEISLVTPNDEHVFSLPEIKTEFEVLRHDSKSDKSSESGDHESSSVKEEKVEVIHVTADAEKKLEIVEPKSTDNSRDAKDSAADLGKKKKEKKNEKEKGTKKRGSFLKFFSRDDSKHTKAASTETSKGQEIAHDSTQKDGNEKVAPKKTDSHKKKSPTSKSKPKRKHSKKDEKDSTSSSCSSDEESNDNPNKDIAKNSHADATVQRQDSQTKEKLSLKIEIDQQKQQTESGDAILVKSPTSPKSQKTGKFPKFLPLLRSPSKKENDLLEKEMANNQCRFDGQYHREDDISQDVPEPKQAAVSVPKQERQDVQTSEDGDSKHVALEIPDANVDLDDKDQAAHAPSSSETAVEKDVDSRRESVVYKQLRHFVVVAVDFGTTHSGYAFSFVRDPSSVYMMRRWAGEEPGVVNQKTLTSLLLTPKGEFHSFGYSARSNYLNLVPVEAKHWMYFSTFKMELHHNSDLNRDTKLVAVNGARFSALKIFSFALEFFKNHALQQLSDQSGTELLNEDIRWVITVPAIWKAPAKQFMRQAAYEAGMASPNFPEQLLIALEPEAAAIYCRRLRMHQLVPEHPINRPLQSPTRESIEIINADLAVTELTLGSRYMIVDCGGGTIDITVHELDSVGHIKELLRASGGPHGSIGVDAEFEKLLCGIFGIEFVEQYKRKFPMGWVHLMTDFESRKRSASPYKNTSLNVSPPFTFINDYKKHKSDPENAVKKYGDSEVEWSPQGMLRLTPIAMRRLFLPTLTHIKQAIGDVLNHPNAREIKYMFLVGGFAESPILQHEMRSEFGNIMKILIPQEVSLAILKGAVLFGIDPSIVNVRRSRLTYGVGILNRFDPDLHPASKRVRRDGVDWCTDIFDKYVETDQPIMLGNTVVRSYTPAKKGQLNIVLNIYSCENSNVKFITDPSVTRCGTLCLNLPVLDEDVDEEAAKKKTGPREIQARMSFGDTEINVVAIDVNSGKGVKASVDFLGR